MRTLVLSTSSPQAAAALLDGPTVLAFRTEHAPRQAEAALFQVLASVLEEAETFLSDVGGFIADVGPGSFTGVRVGVTVAKTLAWAQGVRVGGISSFDLIAGGAVAVPSRRDMYLLRDQPGAAPKEVSATDPALKGASGYGKAFPAPLYPDPRRAALYLEGLGWIAPEELLPWYVLEPGISTPKTAYPRVSE